VGSEALERGVVGERGERKIDTELRVDTQEE